MLDIDDDDDGADTATSDADRNDAPPSADGPTHVTRELECVLSDTEVRERGQLMAQDEREIERLKIRRKALNAQIRAKFEHMTECALAIDSRKEVREVACTWRPDYDKKLWELQRDDTKRVFQTRAMTSADLQTRLPLDSATNADAREDAADDGDDGEHDDDDDDAGADIDDDELGAAIDHLRELGPVEVTDDDGDDDAPDASYAPPALLPARSTPEAHAVMMSARGGGGGKARAAKATKPATKRAPKVRTRAAANTNGRSSKRR